MLHQPNIFLRGGQKTQTQQDGQGQAKAQNGHNDRNRGAPSNGGGNQSVVTEDQESTYAESTAFSTHRTDLTETVMSDDHRTATESAQVRRHLYWRAPPASYAIVLYFLEPNSYLLSPFSFMITLHQFLLVTQVIRA